MKDKLKVVFSLMAIIFFMLIALSSIIFAFLEGSTNTTVKIGNCQEKPGASGTLEVTVTALDSLDNPLAGVKGDMFITHQKVRPDTCAFDVVFNVRNAFTTGANGQATYTGPDWIHDNSEDLFRVEVEWRNFPTGTYPVPPRQTIVKRYNESTFSFTAKQLPRL